MTDWTRDDWVRADRLLDAALERPPDEREAYVRAAGQSAEVIEHVLRLLASAEAAEARIGESVQPLAERVAERREEAAPIGAPPPEFSQGTVIGSYRIVSEIGRGGMGTVYLAERSDDKYDRRVALKVVKRGMDTDEVVARFRREGQILARLEHPHIARMYDADVAPDGRPYLVLEYVEGRAIDAHCDAERLGVEERVRLFLEVCDAVAFAHSQLVLHRDLKPSNILVSDDGPRLLDFGVAKVLDDGPDETRDLTSLVGRRLTPEYASPEQLAGGEIATTSDVYSLGVVLYELLTGTRPAPGPTRPPSAVVTHEAAGTDTRSSAASRRSTPRALARRLHGDLDVILLGALHEEPSRRYPSVEAFAADLRRHLGGHPVTARPDSMPYRVRKFVVRNRLPVLSGSGVGVSVVLFAIGSIIQTAETARERDRAEQERARAEAVAAVFEEMFTGAGFESGERIDTMTVRTFLDRSAEEVLAELDAQPVVQGTLLRVLGTAQHQLGRLAQADSLLTAAVSVLETAEPLDLRALLVAQRDLGHVKQRKAQWPEAIELYETWLSGEMPLEIADVAEVTHNVAVARLQMGDLETAIAMEDSVIAIHRANRDLDAEGFGAALTMRAGMARQAGDDALAIELAEEAVERVRAALGDGHPRLFVYEHNYALLLYRSGEPHAAETLFADLLTRYRAQIGQSVELARAQTNYGNVLRDVGRPLESLTMLEEALAVERRVYGSVHPAVAVTLEGLGATLEALGRVREAAVAYEERVEIVGAVFGPEHQNTAMAILARASARCAGGLAGIDALAPEFDRVAALLERGLPAGHPAHAEVEQRRTLCAEVSG